MTEIQKRRSGTISGAERITGVKNAMAEVILGRTLNQYGLKYRKRLQVRDILSRDWIGKQSVYNPMRIA